MITITVSGEQGCDKSRFIEWLANAIGVTPWDVKEIVEVSEE